MTIAEEQQLIKQAQNEPEAFGQIFDIYYAKIFNYSLRRVQNRQMAEDLTSEIFFKALAGLKKFRWQSAPFGAWLFKIAHNEVISYYRKGLQKTVSLDQIQAEGDFDFGNSDTAASALVNKESQSEQLQIFNAIKDKLNTLPDKYKEVLSLRYFEKLSILDIATVLEKPEGTIKSLLSRGIDLLRGQITNANPILQPFEPTTVVINEALN